MQRAQYNPALDGLRAVAVILVMGRHAQMPGMTGGFVGVDVFFVLSGFLITRLLLVEHSKSGDIQLLAFYWRRARRLYPALLLMLAAYIALGPTLWPQYTLTDLIQHAAVAALYLSDYGLAYFEQPHVITHTWSLSVEEHFYLVWPAMLLIMLRAPRHNLPALLGLLFIITTAGRWWSVAQGFDVTITYNAFHLHCSGMVLGAFLASLPAMQFSQNSIMPTVLLTLSMAILANSCVKLGFASDPSLTIGILLTEIAAALAIVSLESSARPLSHPWLVRLGLYSYGVYLWHYPIFRLLRVDYPGWPTFIIGGAISIALAAFSYHTVERAVRASSKSGMVRGHPSRA